MIEATSWFVGKTRHTPSVAVAPRAQPPISGFGARVYKVRVHRGLAWVRGRMSIELLMTFDTYMIESRGSSNGFEKKKVVDADAGRINAYGP